MAVNGSRALDHVGTGKSVVVKALSFGGSGLKHDDPWNQFPSKQILEDPFTTALVAGYGVILREPPYKMEQLLFLSEGLPSHSTALEQIAHDTVAKGPKWEPDGTKNETQLKKLETWWESLFEQFTSVEVLQSMMKDFETVGWGMLECARDVQGVLQKLYQVPGHTVRSHQSGSTFAQIRQGKLAWFKRWGIEEVDFGLRNGLPVQPGSLPLDQTANELLMFRRPNSRSTWYTVPRYISALRYITMGIAAADYNILFFNNSREPRHMIFITGMEEDVLSLMDQIEERLKQEIKDPFRNIVIGLTGNCKVEIQRMSDPSNDMHFQKMMDAVDERVLVGHAMPGDRIGIVKRGTLAGGITATINRIYKEGRVAPNQFLMADRLTKFAKAEYEKKFGEVLNYHANMEELDIGDESDEATTAIGLVKADLIAINEGRVRLGMTALNKYKDPDLDPTDPESDLTLTEYIAKFGKLSNGAVGADPASNSPGDPGAGGDGSGGSGGDGGNFGNPTLKSARDHWLVQSELLNRMNDLEEAIEEMVTAK